jgi:hypothetical protein
VQQELTSRVKIAPEKNNPEIEELKVSAWINLQESEKETWELTQAYEEKQDQLHTGVLQIFDKTCIQQ